MVIHIIRARVNTTPPKLNLKQAETIKYSLRESSGITISPFSRGREVESTIEE
jgi:hypothetical protein